MEAARDSIREFFTSVEPKWIVAGVIVLLALFFLPRLARAMRALVRKPDELGDLELDENLADFSDVGPDPSDPLALFCRQVPVRIGLVIVAPLGRDHTAPADSTLPNTAECVMPGLGKVIARDRPEIRSWPVQLSAKGFIHSVLRHVHLPGDRGRNTPWCLVAGRAQGPERPFLLGMALCADAPNALSEIAVESEEKWHDILRVRDEE